MIPRIDRPYRLAFAVAALTLLFSVLYLLVVRQATALMLSVWAINMGGLLPLAWLWDRHKPSSPYLVLGVIAFLHLAVVSYLMLVEVKGASELLLAAVSIPIALPLPFLTLVQAVLFPWMCAHIVGGQYLRFQLRPKGYRLHFREAVALFMLCGLRAGRLPRFDHVAVLPGSSKSDLAFLARLAKALH